MFNSCSFTGRFASEPKCFETNGVKRVVFTLAVDRDQRQDDGEYDTDFLDFVCWRSNADFVSSHFHKGDLATVANARAQVRTFETNSGEKQRRVEFLVDRIYFGQAKKREENS